MEVYPGDNSRDDQGRRGLDTTPPGTVPVEFTLVELWLLQSAIRHEMERQDTWKFPPSSLELNEQITQAIFMCEGKPAGATLALSYGDCLAIDFRVPNNAKDENGVAIGKSILLKTYQARSLLATGGLAAFDPTNLTREQVVERMKEFKE